MNTRYLKAATISSLMAVLVGVISFGVNIAAGVESPSISPQVSQGVSPTFNGATFEGVVSVDDDLSVTGGLDVDGAVNTGAGLTVGDSLSVAEGLSVGADLSVAGDLGVNGSLNTNNIDVAQRSVFGGIFEIDQNGKLSLKGRNGNEIEAWSRLILNSVAGVQIGTANQRANLHMKGGIYLDDGAFIQADDNEVFIRSNVEMRQGLNVVGHISAGSIGQQTVRYFGNDLIALNPDQYGSERRVSCNAGEILLSCGLEAYTADDRNFRSAAISTQSTRLTPTANPKSCYVSAYNPYSSARYYMPYALCLDPSS